MSRNSRVKRSATSIAYRVLLALSLICIAPVRADDGAIVEMAEESTCPSATSAIADCERLIEAYQQNDAPIYGGPDNIIATDNPLNGQTLTFRGRITQTDARARSVTLGVPHHFRLDYTATPREAGHILKLQNDVKAARERFERHKQTRGKARTKSQKRGRREQAKAFIAAINTAQKKLGEYLRGLRERTEEATHDLSIFVGSDYPVGYVGERVEICVAVRAMTWNNNGVVPTMIITGSTPDAVAEYTAPSTSPLGENLQLLELLALCDQAVSDLGQPAPNETTLAKQVRQEELTRKINRVLKDRKVRFRAMINDVRKPALPVHGLRYELDAQLVGEHAARPQRVRCYFDEYARELIKAGRGEIVPLVGQVISVNASGYEKGSAAKYDVAIRVIEVESREIVAIPPIE